jgi:hypothetical protein
MTGVSIEHQPEFFSLVQDRYRVLLERGENFPLAVIKAIQEEADGHPVFAGVAEKP